MCRKWDWISRETSSAVLFKWAAYTSHMPPVLRSLKDTIIQISTYLLNSAFMFRGPSRSLFTDLLTLFLSANISGGSGHRGFCCSSVSPLHASLVLSWGIVSLSGTCFLSCSMYMTRWKSWKHSKATCWIFGAHRGHEVDWKFLGLSL